MLLCRDIAYNTYWSSVINAKERQKERDIYTDSVEKDKDRDCPVMRLVNIVKIM